jgi:hypothetical protein
MKCKLMEVSHIDFLQNVWKGLWDMWETPFVALCKLGFIMDQCGRKSDLHHNF